MQGSLHKPIIDQGTQTFVDRCAQLSLSVWTCTEQTLSTPTGEASLADITNQLQSRLDEIKQSDSPVCIAAEISAAWIPDTDGPNEGFIVVQHNNEPDFVALAQALRWNLDDLRRADGNNHAVEDLTEQLGQCYENITMLYGIGTSMSSLEAPQHMAQGICDQIRTTQGYGWSAVRFIRDNQDISGLSDACMINGQIPCDQNVFRKTTGQMLASWDEDNWSKLLQIGRDELAEQVQSEVILGPIRHDGRVIGLVLAGGKSGPDAEATSGDTQLLDAIAGFLGALHENAARFVEQKNMFIGSLKAVSTALDAKDRYTFGHSERVAWLGTQLAEAIGLDAEEVERIRISGLVHDVGKIGVPEAVLCKTGRLTDEEFDQIKKHPRIGFNILKGIPKMADVLDGVLYHHERWDGRGYPDNLAGEAIPLYGRILAVADTFDAMSSTRSYRQAMPREKVLEEIVNCSGTQFDPELTGPFLSIDFAEYDRMVAAHQGASTSVDQADLAA